MADRLQRRPQGGHGEGPADPARLRYRELHVVQEARRHHVPRRRLQPFHAEFNFFDDDFNFSNDHFNFSNDDFNSFDASMFEAKRGFDRDDIRRGGRDVDGTPTPAEQPADGRGVGGRERAGGVERGLALPLGLSRADDRG